ncbi:BAQ_1a_G0016470.mRNA.1.CDS.1 [Saccharomyces cerevisiae]|nr:BAM_G0013580.mRNA.1.CDS.1 [Saccharomyces cerevisiae]CAI4439630.1 BAQ_1a_G0016470.mRNA.1.CDS.1 [Saccharomyces cerevisiae]CAI7093916.1 BAM_G0013580.mRNA.1.CDS.1 [Saccharomyces cerevisiae]CAI7106451.1 BAQ_1a_G0016470.mRNA.1.CDS.1 [Saccharomyces cerevisiae]
MMPTYLGKLTWSYFFTTLGLSCAYNVTEQMEFDQFKSDYLACLAPEHRNIVVDLASNGFITISPMANATIDFEDVTSDYFNCTDVNTKYRLRSRHFTMNTVLGPIITAIITLWKDPQNLNGMTWMLGSTDHTIQVSLS